MNEEKPFFQFFSVYLTKYLSELFVRVMSEGYSSVSLSPSDSFLSGLYHYSQWNRRKNLNSEWRNFRLLPVLVVVLCAFSVISSMRCDFHLSKSILSLLGLLSAGDFFFVFLLNIFISSENINTLNLRQVLMPYFGLFLFVFFPLYQT